MMDGGIRRWSLALTVVGVAAAGIGACAPGGEDDSSSSSALNSSPQIGDFVVYASNSAALRDRVVVTGADVGVRTISPGPTLVTGFELGISTDVRVDVTQDVMGNRVQ